MWVILVNDGLTEHRENRIMSIMDNYSKESFLGKYLKSYNMYPHIENSLIFKTKNGALRVINKFNMQDPIAISYYNNPFYLIKNKILSIRKISKDEWDKIIDLRISKLDLNYNSKKNKLLKKKSFYKNL